MGEKALRIGSLERATATVVGDLMGKRGWTASRLAAEAGLNRARVYTLLDSRSPMTVSTLEALCGALGTRVSIVTRQAEKRAAERDETPVPSPDQGHARG